MNSPKNKLRSLIVVAIITSASLSAFADNLYNNRTRPRQVDDSVGVQRLFGTVAGAPTLNQNDVLQIIQSRPALGLVVGSGRHRSYDYLCITSNAGLGYVNFSGFPMGFTNDTTAGYEFQNAVYIDALQGRPMCPTGSVPTVVGATPPVNGGGGEDGGAF